MHLVQDSTAIVLAGIWNPAILNPSWLLRYVHDIPTGQGLPVQLEQAVMPAGQPTRYGIGDIKYTPSRNQLVLQPVSVTPENLNLVQEKTRRILTLLPHTPVAGLGQNFQFSEENPSEEQLAVFAAANDLSLRCDFEFELRSTGVVSSIQFDNRTLNIARTNRNGQLFVAFNFHYNTTSAENAAEQLQHPIFVENLAYATRILRCLYAIEVDMHQDQTPQAQPLQAQAV